MAYRVNPDGSIDCPTAEEALNLQALILSRRMTHQANGNGALRPPDRPQQAELPDLARSFLGALLEHPRSAQEIAQALDTNTTSFPPMYRGLRKWAISVGLEYDTLIVRTDTPNGTQLSINDQARNIVEHAVKQ